ncbi:transketolase [Paraburkholderia xenovorans]|uniref:transketolase family protein n=1 Tax=Paraburkholderia xenovorans TaxID=36873 RepID=UPI0038BCA502
MRNAFIDELIAQAEQHEDIVLVVGDLGYGVVEPFAKRFPERFFNAGVAEQNMTGLAAGLASEGYHVFTYSIANFPTFRCAEQIRNDIDYHGLPVTVVAVGGGLAYGNLGYSHHAVQDYGLMRMFPNMLIAAPGDPMEVRACVRYLCANPGPSYLRLGKAGEPSFHDGVPEIAPGKWLTVKSGNAAHKTLLSTGAALEFAMSLATDSSYVDYAVHSLPLWGMGQKATQEGQVEAWQAVVTLEDHLEDAGFGSWLREAVTANPQLMLNIKTWALNSSVCGKVAKQATLNALGGLTPGAAT